jgi:aminoacyl tRNA synthase complex-interacting multifunctional protein 1
MVLCASNADHTAVEFVIPPEGVKVGERVTFDGFAGEPESENKVAKKKILEKLAPDLKTNNDGVVVWKGIKCETSAGPCVASKGMMDAQVS